MCQERGGVKCMNKILWMALHIAGDLSKYPHLVIINDFSLIWAKLNSALILNIII